MQGVVPSGHQLKRNHAIATDDIPDTLLYCLESHGATRLTFQMVDDSSQSLEVGTASAIWAVIEVLAICAGRELAGFSVGLG